MPDHEPVARPAGGDSAPLPLALVAAVARNGVIGRDNALPWSIPSDLKHFRSLTLGQPTLMGRRTFESIGRPLPGRHVIVLSGDAGFAAEGVAVARTLRDALTTAQAIGQEKAAREILVAGGGLLYRALIGVAQRLHITEVGCAPAGDTRFPPIDPAVWRAVRRIVGERSPGDDADFAFVTFERIAGPLRTPSAPGT